VKKAMPGGLKDLRVIPRKVNIREKRSPFSCLHRRVRIRQARAWSRGTCRRPRQEGHGSKPTRAKVSKTLPHKKTSQAR
jgi:hypothetical protein